MIRWMEGFIMEKGRQKKVLSRFHEKDAALKNR
jgi:hypothetical protein